MRRLLFFGLLVLSALVSSTPRAGGDKDDCEDCVIVLAPGKHPRGAETALGHTLWGLFLAARPRSQRKSIQA